ncbi:MAG: RHS repeat-associated core domain-containing protein [Planctomycetota bacterium]|nr:RHS repeat-associated core domain-containing protein [Planctomycetota bacterium]
MLWHGYYIDALAVRYYDSNPDGSGIGEENFTHDANFSVTAVTGNTGTVLERYQYDPYGRLTVLEPNFTDDGDNTSDISNGTTYPGRRLDGEIGLMHYRARYYHPTMGRFVARDPIEYEGNDYNLYRYVSDCPIGFTNPFGQLEQPWRFIPPEQPQLPAAKSLLVCY